MTADWVARATALGSGTVGLVSLGWNVVAWRRQGPVVKVTAACSGRGDQMLMSGTIRNTGRFDAKLDSASFGWLSSSTGSGTHGQGLTCQLPAEHLEGLGLKDSLPAQSGREFTVVRASEIDPGLNVALHDRRRVRLTFRTASGRKASTIIKYTN